MNWTSIRSFLQIPDQLTGKNVNIAVIDGRFPHHPDISSNENRETYMVRTNQQQAEPELVGSKPAPQIKGSHGLSCAAAAAGSGQLSNGYYSGAAPHANLYLLETGACITWDDVEQKFGEALLWLKSNWRKYHIRAVVLTVAASRDTGLLPWQADPVRILCEQLADDGLLVISSSGNTKELICNGPSASPSVLSVGGVIVPEDAGLYHAPPYHGCRGTTFENKWVPEIVAPAENVVLPEPFQSEAEFLDHFTASSDQLPAGYARTEGTSYAGPIILGAAACIWEANPSWSSFQVKSALLGSCRISGQVWAELRSGIVDVSAAVDCKPTKGLDSVKSPFAQWSSWKRKKKSERLAAITGRDDKEIVEALLSYLSEPDSLEWIPCVRPLLKHREDKIRAAAITLMSEHASLITRIDLRHLFKDSSVYVQMGALFALRRCPDMWKELSEEIIRLISGANTDLNIQYAASRLATTIKSQAFIKPLISGLKNDALCQNVTNFGERCNALEQITGVHFEAEPRWRDGECFYSERSTRARLDLAMKWTSWLQQHG